MCLAPCWALKITWADKTTQSQCFLVGEGHTRPLVALARAVYLLGEALLERWTVRARVAAHSKSTGDSSGSLAEGGTWWTAWGSNSILFLNMGQLVTRG